MRWNSEWMYTTKGQRPTDSFYLTQMVQPTCTMAPGYGKHIATVCNSNNDTSQLIEIPNPLKKKKKKKKKNTPPRRCVCKLYKLQLRNLTGRFEPTIVLFKIYIPILLKIIFE